MSSWVSRSVVIEAQRWPTVERFLADPAAWLPPPATRHPDGGWVVALHAGASPEVVVRVGDVWRLPDACSRPVRWQAPVTAGRHELVPSFDGRLSLRYSEEFGREGTLTLTGHYRPPLGALGRVLDALALHRLGEVTVDRLLRDVARRLVPVASPVGVRDQRRPGRWPLRDRDLRLSQRDRPTGHMDGAVASGAQTGRGARHRR